MNPSAYRLYTPLSPLLINTLSYHRRPPPLPLRLHMAVKTKMERRWTAKNPRIYLPYLDIHVGCGPLESSKGITITAAIRHQ